MQQIALLGMMYVAIGVGLFAQPAPGTAEPHDFTWWRQAEIFRQTFAAVLTWPVVLLRRFGC